MRVDLKDGSCRSCGGPLEIIDADDATMTVECTGPGCGDLYLVETDAFGDGGIEYHLNFLLGRESSHEPRRRP